MNVKYSHIKYYGDFAALRMQKNKANSFAFSVLRKESPGQRTASRWGKGILKNKAKLDGSSEKWNVSYSSSDLYYRTMRKSRSQIYDELLVIKCQPGEKDAFDELVERWQKRLWHYACRITGSESAAWDIVQETWFAIVKGLSKLKDTAVFPQWAFRIVNNKCTDWLRKQQRRSRLNNQLEEHAQSQSASIAFIAIPRGIWYRPDSWNSKCSWGNDKIQIASYRKRTSSISGARLKWKIL